MDWFDEWKTSNLNIKEYLQKKSINDLNHICQNNNISECNNKITKNQLINLITENLITSINCNKIKRKRINKKGYDACENYRGICIWKNGQCILQSSPSIQKPTDSIIVDCTKIKRKKINEKGDSCDNHKGICIWKNRKCIQLSPPSTPSTPSSPSTPIYKKPVPPLNTNMKDVYSMYLEALNISKIPKKEFDINHCKFAKRILNNLRKYDRPTTKEIAENAISFLETISVDEKNLFCFQIRMFVEIIDSNKDIGCPFDKITKDTGVTESEYEKWMKNPSKRPKEGTFEYSKMQEAMSIKFCSLLRYLILRNLSDVVNGKKPYNKYSYATATQNIYKNRNIKIPKGTIEKCEDKYYPQLEIR